MRSRSLVQPGALSSGVCPSPTRTWCRPSWTPRTPALAEFYRQLLGYEYRPGDEPPTDGSDDVRGRDWLVLLNPREPTGPGLAFQQVEQLPRSTWPTHEVPQQLHFDMVVADVAGLRRQARRAEKLGATLRYDRTDDTEEPLLVYAGPSGHPFCLFVG